MSRVVPVGGVRRRRAGALPFEAAELVAVVAGVGAEEQQDERAAADP